MPDCKPLILFLAPQPFYQERGTPIAVRLALSALSQHYKINLLTYNEGFDVPIKDVTHIRMWAPKWLVGVRPGVSLKKLIADFFFSLSAVRLLIKGDYQIVHAVEEAIFLASPFCLIYKSL